MLVLVLGMVGGDGAPDVEEATEGESPRWELLPNEEASSSFELLPLLLRRRREDDFLELLGFFLRECECDECGCVGWVDVELLDVDEDCCVMVSLLLLP